MSQGGMVSVDDEMSSLQINPTFAEGVHDGKGFLFMGSIVEFIDIHLVRSESDWLRLLALVLHEYGANSEVRCIGGHCEWKFRVRNAQNRSFCHASLQLFEGFCSSWCPKEGSVLVSEICQWCGNLGVAFDEPSIVIAET